MVTMGSLPHLRVLVVQEDGRWLAVCLEHAVTASGDSFQQVHERFITAMVGQVAMDLRQGIAPLSRTPRAPEAYQAAWDHRSGMLTPTRQVTKTDMPWAPDEAIQAVSEAEFATV